MLISQNLFNPNLFIFILFIRSERFCIYKNITLFFWLWDEIPVVTIRLFLFLSSSVIWNIQEGRIVKALRPSRLLVLPLPSRSDDTVQREALSDHSSLTIVLPSGFFCEQNSGVDAVMCFTFLSFYWHSFQYYILYP